VQKWLSVGPLWTVALACVFVGGCGSDPRDLDGALAKAAAALADDDPAELFKVIDQRARHAMVSIVNARHKAAEVIRASYPEADQARALAELGDAKDATDAAGLFAMRCAASCRQELAAKVGTPTEQHQDGDVTVVHTSRGGELRLFHGNDSWWGIVWNTEALARERTRASAELDLVQKNAVLYRQQKVLEGSAE
jgi:hypothetical protein